MAKKVGPLASIGDEDARHMAIRGFMLTSLPLAMVLIKKETVVPTAAEVHTWQVLAWSLSGYGVDLPGMNWGAPAFATPCPVGGGLPDTVLTDDGETCVVDFVGKSDDLAAAENHALVAFMATCLATPGLKAAADAGDADAVASALNTPPFVPGGAPSDLEDASALIAKALSENPC